MIRNIFITILFILLATLGNAQITIQAAIPSVGLIQKDQLWTITITNASSVTYNCKIILVVKDRFTGQDILSGTTGYFEVRPGASQFNSGSFADIHYNNISASFESGITGLMPVGSYLACYSLGMGHGDLDLADNCIEFDVEPLSPPLLNFPTDSMIIDVDPSVFNWTAPTPDGIFNSLHYDIIIAPVYDGQKAEEAIQQNIPFYSGSPLMNNFFNYPSSGIHFEKNVWYAWQVIARDNNKYAGKSETWVFSVKNPEDKTIPIELFPFMKMKKGEYLRGVAPNGIFKCSYINEAKDSIVQIRISKLNEKNVFVKTIMLKNGENLIENDLSKNKLDEGGIYEATITNSRGEKWGVQFQLKKIKSK